MSKPTLIVYGATSFTGKELLQYLDNHPEGDKFNVILSGRNFSKLQGVAAKLQNKYEIMACQLTNEDEVNSLVAKGDVVMNLAGPFITNHGEALVKACATTGKHYVDISGETHWLAADIVPKYHELALKTGACIVPSCGFDCIPSDVTVYAALRTLQSQYPKATITNSISYFKLQGSVSGGSLQTLKASTEIKDELVDEWVLVRGTGPSPKPKMIYATTHPSVDRSLIGSFFNMFPVNRAIVRRAWFLSRLNQDNPSGRGGKGKDGEPVHGSDFVYEESMEWGSKLKSFLFSVFLTVFYYVFYGSRLTRDIALSLLPKSGEGAPDEDLRKGYFKITNISKTTEKGVDVITTCEGRGDPGYISTGYMLTESALALVLPPPSGSLPPLGRKGGVLTPSIAFGQVIIDRLEAAGKVFWKSEVVESKKAK